MMINLFVLLLAAGTWLAALWLLIQADFAGWTLAGIAAVHAIPPLVVWLLWFGLRRRSRRLKAAEAQEREASAQAERQAALEAAQKKHADDLRQRRFACNCRAVAIDGLKTAAEFPPLQADLPGINISGSQVTEATIPTGETILDHLAPAITAALSKVYATCRAGFLFPIYVSPPAEVSGEEVLARIRAIHAELAAALALDVHDKRPSILFLPVDDCASNSVISLFETTPDLPGAIVLAFDSPLFRSPADDSLDEPTPEQIRRDQQVGKPGEGVVAMLLTNGELPSMLDAVAGLDAGGGEQDSMTPFWKKSLQPGGNLALLAAADAEAREEMARLPVLGRIHRAAYRQPAQARCGVLELSRLMQDALERAQVNAGLIDPPFVHADTDAASPEKEADQASTPSCGAIVHNAGCVDVAGKRLAALGTSLYYFGIDLSPVDADATTNLVTRIGDLGRAAAVVQLALGVTRAAQQSCPVLCVEYSGDESIAAGFVMPLSADA